MSKLQDRNDAKRGKLSIAFNEVLRDLAQLHGYEEAMRWCVENGASVDFGKHFVVHTLNGAWSRDTFIEAVEAAQEGQQKSVGGDGHD